MNKKRKTIESGIWLLLLPALIIMGIWSALFLALVTIGEKEELA
jgi:hypothetical protein